MRFMWREIISRKEALQEGMSEDAIFRKLKSGKWQLLFPNVYFTKLHSPSWEQRMAGACRWAGPEVLASHRAAARLLRFPGFDDAPVELTAVRDLRPRNYDVIVHRVRALPTPNAKVGNIPVTTATWTLVNLAGVLEFDELQALIDWSICAEVTTWERLENAADASAGEPGVLALRRILKERRAAESVLQRDVQRLLVEARYPSPLLEYPEGRFRIDLAYPQDRLAIETDGYGAHSNRQAFGEDRRKQNYLMRVGWRVLRFTWDDLTLRPDYIVATVGAFLNLDGRRPRS
jgi:very-short-patch-repair endonuclease